MIYHCNPNGGNIYLELMVLLVSIVNVVGRSEEEYKGRASEWSNPEFFSIIKLTLLHHPLFILADNDDNQIMCVIA